MCGEYGPTCSIIGGMLAQEVVKSLSKSDGPTTFVYFFNHLRCQMSGIPLVNQSSLVEKNNEEISSDSIVEL